MKTLENCYYERKISQIRKILSNPSYFGDEVNFKVSEWSEDELISYVLYAFIDDNKRYLCEEETDVESEHQEEEKTDDVFCSDVVDVTSQDNLDIF